ncbi:hypothetical protein Pcac1_g21976 [Phytophthora cactorum]|nr:hypothetical protein Pcac1_g21976 [Phytophthora cactorum]
MRTWVCTGFATQDERRLTFRANKSDTQGNRAFEAVRLESVSTFARPLQVTWEIAGVREGPPADAAACHQLEKPQEEGCQRRIKSKRKEQNGHTGARTLDRSVISTVLYRLSYTTAKRNTHTYKPKYDPHHKNHNTYTHTRCTTRFCTTLRCSTASASSLPSPPTKPPLSSYQTHRLLQNRSPSRRTDAHVGMHRLCYPRRTPSDISQTRVTLKAIEPSRQSDSSPYRRLHGRCK